MDIPTNIPNKKGNSNRAMVYYMTQNYVYSKTAKQNIVGYEKLCAPVMLHVPVNFPRHFHLWI